MFKEIKEFFGFPSKCSGPLKPHLPWPDEMINAGSVRNIAPPPCPPRVESELFKKAKDILKLPGFELYEIIGCSCFYRLGNTWLHFWDGYNGDRRIYIDYKNKRITLSEEEARLLGKFWHDTRKEELRIQIEKNNSEFLNPNINELAGNKSGD